MAKCAFHPWKATGSIRQPGKDARRIRMRVHDRAACRRQHYTTSLSRQARKPVVRPPWNGYIHSNEKGVFLCILSFVAQQKKVRVKKYDANGNLTAVYDTAKQFNRILSWDDDNRLTKTVDTTNGSSVATSYAYDAKGMRIVKDGPYGKSIYIDTGYVESGAPQTTAPIVSNHIFVGNTRVASVVKHIEEKQPATYFYASDHLGSSSVLTTQQGSYHERIEYLPYGETWVEDKAISDGYSTPYKFTGKELDTETGLYYFGARYYDARVSRWISADPALEKYIPKPNDYDTEHDFYWYIFNDASGKLPGMGGVYNSININVYCYGGLNPVKFVDPDGNDIILLNKSYGAAGNGHNGVLIGNDNYGWHYFSKDGIGSAAHNHATYKTLADFIVANMNSEERLNDYDRGYRVETNVGQDIDMVNAGYEYIDRGYSFSEKNKNGEVKQNCADLAADIISAGGLKIEKPRNNDVKVYGVPAEDIFGEITEPNTQFNNFMRDNKGEAIKFRTEPPVKSLLPPKG
ncbi:MAG TPA: RHS repeat-associated core domain-containing protein [Spirochaetota bacterium]|nr:RHS repeat-associated core domain-containing protein [Spirochaetota bacterium]HQK07744.1 RHS repeat-associated core domain-containing protein [Spirochaetota bacterium]